MFGQLKRVGPLVLRLLAGLALLGCPRIGSAAGTWSVIPLPQQAGEVIGPYALAVDSAGNLYVAEDNNSWSDARIQRRDAQGNWSVIATHGDEIGHVYHPALAVDVAGNLYVADYDFDLVGRIQKRDAQGNWSLIATTALGQFRYPTALAVDEAGNLYVADGDELVPGHSYPFRIQKRDAQGLWTEIATEDQVYNPAALAVDRAGTLYVAEVSIHLDAFVLGADLIQERDAQGLWTEVATEDQVHKPTALAVDPDGNLYVADLDVADLDLGLFGRIQRRDTQGNWSVIATSGSALDQVEAPRGLAVDAAGNLYVADSGNNRVQEYMPGGGQ